MSRGSLLCVQTIFINGCCHGHSCSSSHCHVCRLASVSTKRIMLCRWGCQLWTRMCVPGTSSSWPMCVKRGGGRTGGGRQQDICASLVYQWNHNYTSTKRRANIVDVRDGTKPSCVIPTIICGVAILCTCFHFENFYNTVQLYSEWEHIQYTFHAVCPLGSVVDSDPSC